MPVRITEWAFFNCFHLGRQNPRFSGFLLAFLFAYVIMISYFETWIFTRRKGYDTDVVDDCGVQLSFVRAVI